MQKAFDYIEQNHMLEAGDKIVVGVSGGADSLCLLFVLLEYRRRLPFELLAVHVEHGIRGDASLQDAAFVEELCRRQQVAYRCVSCDVPALAAERRQSLEEAGRAARYAAFARVCRETGANKIAVAHNQSDQAETMLFQMARGSGLAGAAGMRPVRGTIIRPLLGCTRAEIEEYLREKQIAWRTDLTNNDCNFSRNCLRHEILPLLAGRVNPAAVRHLAALGSDLQKIQDYMSLEAKNAADAVTERRSGQIWVNVEGFLQKPEVLQAGILRECLVRAGCALKDVSRKHIESIRALFWKQSGRCVSLPGGWRAQRRFEWVAVWRGDADDPLKSPAFENEVTVPGKCETPSGTFVFCRFPYKNQIILQKRYTKWLDCDKINGNLLLRTRRPGDYLVIGSRGEKKKLKKYLTEEKIPAADREHILLLASGSEILWVVGHRISEAYKITPETKHVLEIQKMGEDDGRENRSIDTGNGRRQQDQGDRAADQ